MKTDYKTWRTVFGDSLILIWTYGKYEDIWDFLLNSKYEEIIKFEKWAKEAYKIMQMKKERV